MCVCLCFSCVFFRFIHHIRNESDSQIFLTHIHIIRILCSIVYLLPPPLYVQSKSNCKVTFYAISHFCIFHVKCAISQFHCYLYFRTKGQNYYFSYLKSIVEQCISCSRITTHFYFSSIFIYLLP